jgi:hypothetical protein
VHQQLAGLIASTAEQPDSELNVWQANAIIGSLTEIVLQAIEQDRVEHLPECADEAAQVIRAAMQSQLAHPVIAPAPSDDPH